MAVSPFSLEKKVAIVTGGGVGIGRSIAVEFARAGADVVICSRKKENLDPVVEEIKKLGRRSFCEAVDVRQEDAVKALVERTAKDMGRLDIMVNNAGASFRAKVEDISANGWNTVIQINVNGVFFGCKWAGKQMMAQGGGGAIINVSSIAGVYGSTMMSHYGTAKAAVINFTRALGMAWGRQGIRVNCIAPGPRGDRGLHGRADQAGPGRGQEGLRRGGEPDGDGTLGQGAGDRLPVHLPRLGGLVLHDGRHHYRGRRAERPRGGRSVVKRVYSPHTVAPRKEPL